ncbi:protein PET100 homolog, mitochondrial isoform X2 [Ursus americanus]|uniref:protein PET100 homolog, mitochondrial isoform X2 n=1 Tax=Ailuropoda melanoleuca TaxID=9646 RepID=UPI0014946062|nr:protein PET100 homolog, mitochondrial isoform X2 [Ailuropoda melanoleuca]XP_045630254.1 protein PET100 homolog, mitochondrial isoform X2 [Ursus americanus]
MLQGSDERMTLYLTFPVAMFWIANQAEWFEDYVIQRKRELWPPEKEDQRRELEEFKERIRKQREEKLLRAAQQSS